MKKSIIGLVGILFMMGVFACDGQDGGNGCDGSDDMPVPTCGVAVVDSGGTRHDDTNLYVNWNGPGAPTEPSNNPGFGEEGQPRPINGYSWSMASFDGQLFVGLQNRINATEEITEGAEVWRYEQGDTVNSGTWRLDLAGGLGNTSNFGVRNLVVYNNQLYAGTSNWNDGAELWRRTPDSATGPGQWQVVAKNGFGNTENTSVRTMAVFNDQLYLGLKNESGATLGRFDTDTQVVSVVAGGSAGIIRETDNTIAELVPFGDYMWIFTWGNAGVSAYRMDRQGNIEIGATTGVGATNSGIISSVVFNDKIYLGTVNFVGTELYVLDNPTVTDPTDVVWKRIGANVFQYTEKYLWRMQEFAGQLYIGAWNPYDITVPLPNQHIGATLYRMNKDEGFCQVMGDGRLIEEGFGRSENYGVRSMMAHNGRLYIGTAQPFKIEPGSDASNAANRQGTEVWEFDPSN